MIISEKVKLFHDDTNSLVINRVISIFNKNGLDRLYDYPSSARVRLIFEGEKIIGTLFNINEIATYLNKIILDDDTYNISEFVMDFSNFSGQPLKKSNSESYSDLYNGNFDSETFADYLIENPEKEFKEYICSNREEDLKKNNIDPNYLANIFSNFLQNQYNKTTEKNHDSNNNYSQQNLLKKENEQ